MVITAMATPATPTLLILIMDMPTRPTRITAMAVGHTVTMAMGVAGAIRLRNTQSYGGLNRMSAAEVGDLLRSLHWLPQAALVR